MLKIFLDQDGVGCNTSKMNCKLLGLDYPKHGSDIDTSEYAWIKNQVSPERFYKSFKGKDFWTGLESYWWTIKLINLVDSLSQGNFKILTRAMDDEECFSGKYLWWEANFPEYIGKLVIVGPRRRFVVDRKEYFEGGEKEFFANSKTDLLIDDSKKNIEAWEKAGGSVYWWKELLEDAPEDVVCQRFEEIRLLVNNLKNA